MSFQRNVYRWLADRAAEGIWQGWVGGLVGGATMTALMEWTKLHPWPSVFIGSVVAICLGSIAQLVYWLRKRRVSALPNCVVLSDAAASMENMRAVFDATKYRFDSLVVTGGTLVRKWIPQIEMCAQRGVQFRFIFANLDDVHCKAFAVAIKKNPTTLKGEVIDVVATLDGIKGRIPNAKIEYQCGCVIPKTPANPIYLKNYASNCHG